MRKYMTLALAVCALTATAQTQESPQTMVMGDNSCTVESYSSAYFSYAAPEDQLVTLEGIPSVTLTSDGNAVANASNSNTNTVVFAAKANAQYLVSIFSITGNIQFTASATPWPYNDGTSCSDPIPATETPFFVPFIKPGGMFAKPTPVYMSYTAVSDGRLEMYFTGQLSSLAYSESCDGEYINVDNGEYSDSQWKASFEVDAGRSYIIRGAASTAMMASFKLVQPTPGASCADAWVAKRGENEIPAAIGSYWYSVTTPAAPAQGFVVLKSDSSLQDAEVTVKNSCTGSYGDITQNDALALRIPATANQFRVLNINKKSATADVEKFTFTYQDYQTYDKFETAEPIEAGQTVTTPEFGGTYYYSVTAPDQGSYFLDLTALAAVASGTKVELYDADKDYWSLATGTDRLHYEVTPGVTYVIKWQCPDNMRSLPFSVRFNAVKAGETESNPLVAVLGDNAAFESASVFFTYTAAEDSWLVVKPSSMSVSRIYSVSENGDKTSVETFKTEDDSAVKFEASSGIRYLMAFADAADGASFELGIVPFAAGETAANPIVVTGNKIDLPDLTGKTWYLYDVAENGILEISTSLTYSYSNSIYVYINEVTDANRRSMSAESYGSENYAMLSMTVRAGDKVFVNTILNSAQADASINFNMRQPEPGETPANPIVIDFATNPMDYTFDQIVSYSDSPVWYSINLKGDIFDMTSEGRFSMSMFAADNTETPIAQSAGSMFGPNHIQNVVVTVPGTYLLKLTSASAAFQVTFSERAANVGEVPAKAIPVLPDKVPYEMEFPAVSVSEMPIWYVIDLNEGEFNLVQEETATAALFKEGDYNDAVATLTYSYSADNYAINNYKVTEAGRYYYRISSAYTVCNATLSGTAIKNFSGITDVNADSTFTVRLVEGGVMINGLDGELEVYTVDGRKVQQLQVEGETMLTLPSGIYIVKTPCKSTEFIVR